MTEPKFTPGPWHVLREGSSDLFVEPAIAYWSKFDIIGRNEEEKKEVWQTKMANAALMAAAPEMYDYLERQLRTLNPEGATAQMIRRILAKARGEEKR